jgi:hypothetical protein
MCYFRRKISVGQRLTEVSPKPMKKLIFVGFGFFISFGLTSVGLADKSFCVSCSVGLTKPVRLNKTGKERVGPVMKIKKPSKNRPYFEF